MTGENRHIAPERPATGAQPAGLQPDRGAGEAAAGDGSLRRNAILRPDPAVIAWAGLAAVAALLVVYSIAEPQSRAVFLTDSPFDSPASGETLAPGDTPAPGHRPDSPGPDPGR